MVSPRCNGANPWIGKEARPAATLNLVLLVLAFRSEGAVGLASKHATAGRARGAALMHPAAEAWEHVDADSSQARGSPQYCCVILVRHTTPTDFPDFLVEQRPAAASVAGGQLTCFGGKREQGEEPLAALLRECEEELGWAPPDVVRACDLFVNGELVAWFYLAAAPPPGTPLRFESGVEAIWATSVTDPRLSPWHAAVLQAWSRGEQRVDLAGSA